MSNVSLYEDISERLEDNRPQRRVFGPLDALDPKDFDVTDYSFALEIDTLRLLIERYTKNAVNSTAPDVRKKRELNEQSRLRIRELRAQLNSEHEETISGKIGFLERANAERLHDIVNLTLTDAQKHNVAKFERRLINGTPIQNHCYCCKRPFIETAKNYCIDCGRVRCPSCDHCFCN
jgi:hypothetical protein